MVKSVSTVHSVCNGKGSGPLCYIIRTCVSSCVTHTYVCSCCTLAGLLYVHTLPESRHCYILCITISMYVHLESPYFVPMEVTVLADADCAYINTENQSCIHGPHRYWDSKVHTYTCMYMLYTVVYIDLHMHKVCGKFWSMVRVGDPLECQIARSPDSGSSENRPHSHTYYATLRQQRMGEVHHSGLGPLWCVCVCVWCVCVCLVGVS